jgi:hypothetical protein
MPILLFTDADACAGWATALSEPGPALLLSAGSSALAEPLRAALPDLVEVEVTSPRFARINFDALSLLVVDLPAEFLEGAAGRRLFDALGRLAAESLALAFVGAPAALTGGRLLDGVHAGLSLVPRTAVIPNLQTVGDLHTLLSTLSRQGVRLLALDASVGVRYDAGTDRVAVRGTGSVLLAAFDTGPGAGAPTARLHVLTDGMSAGWPE